MELIARRHHRIDLLDAIRGVAILSMVFYHALYDIADVFGYRLPLFDLLGVLEPPFAGAFILLAGVSCRFSHNNWKRGGRVLVLAMVITLVTVLFSRFFVAGQEIYFGILHFMGAAILLFALLHRALDRIPPKVGLVLWSALFLVTYRMPYTYLVGLPGLTAFRLPAFLTDLPGMFLLGVPDPNFSSADYFPLFPWLFLFFIGTILGVPVKENKLPDEFYTLRVPFLAAAGRNTLLIYMLHQPVIYLLLLAIFQLR